MIASRAAVVGVLLLPVMTMSAAARQAGNGRPIFAPRHGLTHPLVDAGTEEDGPRTEDLRKKITGLIRTIRTEGAADIVSVNYANVEEGVEFGIDDTITFRPASLFKLPLMIAFLKLHELDPELLTRRLPLKRMPRQGKINFPPQQTMTYGATYSIDELLRAMIARSDNDAAYTLSSYMRPGDVERVYRDLGLRVIDATKRDETMAPEDVATFLRVIYQAGYLSWDLSQKAMEYLAASEFDRGLRAKLPPGVTVAEKFGESELQGKNDHQIHDCGIVFHPRSPYLLCVMTSGKDVDKLCDSIARVSELVYREVDAVSAPRKP